MSGNAGIGFPIDPRDLQDGSGRARVFHEHFLSSDFLTFDGTVVFAVFNGPNYTPCSSAGPILPPLPFTYTNAAGDYSIVIDFSRIAQPNHGADDFGQIVTTDWIYAYTVVNDEGVDGVVRGGDAIGAVNLSFADGLRQVLKDLPSGPPTFSLGGTISSTGDIEPAVGAPDTTNPQATSITQALGTFLIFSTSGGGEGCLPDVTNQITPPAGCNSGPFACTANSFFLTSPFGPGVSNIANQGGGGVSANATNVCPGPLTYPNFDCLNLRVNNLSRPGDACIRVGDNVEVLVDIVNPAPATGPPYRLSTIPGGTQRGAVDVELMTMGGGISLTSPNPIRLCTENDQRTAQARFTGVFDGPSSTRVRAMLRLLPPYNTGPAGLPFDSTDADYLNRFTVNRDVPANCRQDIFLERIAVTKQVQFICFNNPADPTDFDLIPIDPTQTVDAPVCGLVRFTIQVQNRTAGETLTNVRVTECLPPELLFRNNVTPPTDTGPASEGVACPPGSTPFVFRIPDLAPRNTAGDTYTFTFDAIVSSSSPAGLKIDQVFARGFGKGSGSTPTCPSNIAEDTAEVNVFRVSARLDAGGVAPPSVCVPQQATFSYTIVNDGLWPLDPVIVGAAQLQPGLTLVSQVPPAGTNIGPLAPGATRAVTVVARADSGTFPQSRCVTVPVSAQPDCYDPRDAQSCRIDLSRQQCVNVLTPRIDVTCITADSTVEPNTQANFQYRISNTGDVAFDSVSLACAVDPTATGLTIVTCPASLGSLAAGASTTVTMVVRSSADRSGRQCAILTATGDPAGLSAECNVTDNDKCCLIGRPQITVSKQVQFVCFPDPASPGIFELRPATPVEQVDAPPCGLVRFTITVTNPNTNEALTNVRVTDCLPADLLFRNNITPPRTTGGPGPDCSGHPGTSPTVFQIPDIPAGGSSTFTFDAIVRSASSAGVKTDFARASGRSTSGTDTNIVEDTARVNVLLVNARLDATSVIPPTVCPPQQSTFTYTIVNTGAWPLDPVFVRAARLDAGLTLVSQTPVANTNVGPLAPGASSVVTVVVRAENGTFPTSRCVELPVDAQPDCYDPRDTERCRIDLTRQQCVTVQTPRVDVTCLTTPDPTVDPNTQVNFQYRITNSGDVAFDTVSFACAVDPLATGLTIVTCPASIGPLAPAATTTVTMVVRSSANRSGRQCAILTATADPAGLPVECNTTNQATCCLVGRPLITVEKQVQFVCFPNPADPTITELRPVTPAEQVDAPPCGLVRFTITVTNPTVNEALGTVRVTDCLPADLLFRDNITPPLTTGGAGPDCAGHPGTTPIVFQCPNIAAGGSFSFTFDAIVKSASTSGLKTDFARAVARGATTGVDTNTVEDTARVNVLLVGARVDNVSVVPASVCPPQQSTFTYRVTNTGAWPLDPLVIRAARLDAGLTLISQTPPANTNIGPLAPGAFRDIVVVVRADAGAFATSRCVEVPIDAQPDCYDPRDTESCRIDLTGRLCVTVLTPRIDVTCLTAESTVPPNTQVNFQYRISNTGDVAFDAVSFACAVDPLATGLTIVTCPAATGTLAAGANTTVTMVVRSSADRSGRQCAILTATGDPAGLPPECNVTDNATCCLIGQPQISVTKQVQFVCFPNPADPTIIELRPASPTEQVDAPPCGLVRFTIRVTNPNTNEALTNVRVTDCLPADLLFRNNIQPPRTTGGPGPDCTGHPGTSPTVFQIPDIPAGGSSTFTFDAIVRSASTAGLKTDFARAAGRGASSLVDTPVVEDTAIVNVLLVGARVDNVSVVPGSVCPPQQSTFTYRVTNTGAWPLDPLVVRAARLDAGLTLISQTPPANTNIGPLAPGAFRDIVVVVRADAGAFATSRCVEVPIDAQPDCYDPRDTESCRIDLTGRLCVTVLTPRIDVTCLTAESTVPPNTQVNFQYRISNTGDVSFDTVSFACTVDAGAPGLTIVTCPGNIGPLAAGANTTVTMVVRSSADRSGRQCAFLAATADPAGLPVECNVTDNDKCCLIGQPQISVTKQVQFVCFPNPADPTIIELRPASPTEQVDAPPCGLVRFTIRVTNPNTNEALTNVRVTDCLPADLLFRNNIQPPRTTGGPGPDCSGHPGTSPTVFQIPDIPAGGSSTFTFDAIVRSASTAGLKTDFARAAGRGATSGIDTPIVEDTAIVNVLLVGARVDNVSVVPGSVCPPQQSTFTYRVTNTGAWPLDPLVIRAARLDAGLTLISQTPPANTNIGPLAPAASRDIVVVVRADAGAFATSRCVEVPIDAQPDCYDPRDTESCRIDLTGRLCVTVLTPRIDVTCLTAESTVPPNTQVNFQYRISNTGDVSFDTVSFACTVDAGAPGLTIVTCPGNIGPLAAGANTTVTMVVRSSADRSGRQCAFLAATADPAGLPVECNVTDNDKCCLIGQPQITVTKQVQFVCFPNPADPTITELRPASPTEQVDAPPCGLVRFTIRVTNPNTNEALTNVRVTDCLPADLLFRNNIQPPLTTGGAGPDCSGHAGTTPTVFQCPDIASGGSFVFTFDAIVKSASSAGLKTDFARAVGRGASTGIDTPTVEDTAIVNVLRVSARLDAGTVNPSRVCPPQQATFTYTIVNTGAWPLDPVIVGAARLDAGLSLVSQDPAADTNIGPLAPAASRVITVVVRSEIGTVDPERCVTVPVTAQPDCYDPRDTERCRIDLERELCVTVLTPTVDVTCLSPDHDVIPGDTVPLQFSVRNTGDVAFETVTFTCTPEPGLTLVSCPAALANLAAGASVTVDMVVTVDAGDTSGRLCADLTALADPLGLPQECNVSDSDECCVLLEGRVPTLGEWGLILLAAGLAFVMIRRRAKMELGPAA